MACNHIELASLLVSIERLETIVQRKVVTGKATADNCCMGCENGSNRNAGMPQVKSSCTSLPLMELDNDLVGIVEMEIVETLYYFSCNDTEKE